MTDTTAPPPTLSRPQYHVWMTPDLTPDLDADPPYVGVVTIRNVDQLTAETQAKALNIKLTDNFHLTNLWIWAAMVREEQTTARFHDFIKRMEYRPVDKDQPAEPDPTFGGQAPSTDSD
jgi:hypothetical protein